MLSGFISALEQIISVCALLCKCVVIRVWSHNFVFTCDYRIVVTWTTTVCHYLPIRIFCKIDLSKWSN